jgi:glycosyltransferase involved in cell wall biosynthesis
MKKVLIITYYWPPSGGAGVQRWLKFIKYLREFGWEPIVYTPENPEAPAIDNSLLKDVPANITVLKQPIWEPYNLYKGFIGQKKGEKINAGFLTEKKKPGLAEKISVWIRGNWFIPDARKFWIKPSVKFLSEYLKKNPVDALVSTGPPHSMHLIALGLKKQLDIPWLADFRDPWTTIDFYDKLMLTRSSDERHKKLELEVLKKADTVLTIGWHIANSLEKIIDRKIDIITNGFDEDDFPTSPLTPLLQERGAPNIKLDEKFSISHIGAMNTDRNPKVLWAALSELLAENENLKKDLKIHFIGKTDYSVLNDLDKFQLSPYVTKTEYLPHAKTTEAMQTSQVLLLALNNTPNTLGVISGKLFEYIAAKRPILAIGKEDGDAARIIKETGAGTICDFTDKEKMKTEISRMYELFRQKNLNVVSSNISNYSRKAQTGKLSEILNQMSGTK